MRFQALRLPRSRLPTFGRSEGKQMAFLGIVSRKVATKPNKSKKSNNMANKIYFLPDEYKEPVSTGGYMRLEVGENKFRIMSPAVFGWEDWVDNKPLRYQFSRKPAKPSSPDRPIKMFFAFVVWNYRLNAIQILHITQATIRKALHNLCQDSDWGEPSLYDLKIIKTGSDKETEYSLTPGAKNPLTQEQIRAFREQPIWLDYLFIGGNPFQVGPNGERTQLTADLANDKPSGFIGALKEVKKAATVPPKTPEQVTQIVDLEDFLALLPDSYDLPKVEEFISKCAMVGKMTIPQYLETAARDLATFKRGYEKYATIEKKTL